MPAPDDPRSAPYPEIPNDLVTLQVAKSVVSQTPPPQKSPSFAGANPAAEVPFIFGKRIAQGGMGAILEASDCKLGRTIAVKVMLSEADCSEEQKQRFVQEAAILGRLEHPNIVPIHDLGLDSEGQLYYTMKLVKGQTLQHILDRLRREDAVTLEHYTLDRLLTIFRKVCDALAFAHAQNIIHRDLKPENIMVGEFGEVLVMDWGISKILGALGNEGSVTGSDGILPSPTAGSRPSLDGTGSFTSTMEGAVMGTPNYMSPEQAMGRVNELDERSDIFSLGGILYAILTLRPPVEGKTVWEVLEKVQAANITSPTMFGATTSSRGKAKPKGEVLDAKKITPLPHMPGGRVPPALSAVAMKALTLDKTKRYQHVAAFSEDIEAFQGGFATSAEGAGLTKQLALLIKRNKGIFTTAAAAWLLVTGLGVWFVLNLRAKEQRATKAEAIAVQERETARQALAKSQLDLAEKEFERGKFVESQKILDETPENFRDANWRFLQAHSRDFTGTLAKLANARQLHVLPGGDRFVAKFDAGGKTWIGVFSLKGEPIGERFETVYGNYGLFGIDHSGGTVSFAVSRNEFAIASLATGKTLRRWKSDVGQIRDVLLSPDGETALAVDYATKTMAHEVRTGEVLWSHSSPGATPAFSPDGRMVAIRAAVSGLDLKISLLDARTGDTRTTLDASTAILRNQVRLQFDQTGNQLACFDGEELILWDTKQARITRDLSFPGEQIIAISPRGQVVLTRSDNKIRLRETNTGQLLRTLNGATRIGAHAAFSPDEKLLISPHHSMTHVWPTRIREQLSSVKLSANVNLGVRFQDAGSRFIATAEKKMTVFNGNNGGVLWKRDMGFNIYGFAVHPADGAIILALVGQKSFARLSETGEPMASFGSKGAPLAGMEISKGGDKLLCSERPSGVRVLDYPSGNIRQTIPLKNVSKENIAVFCLDDAAVATAAPTGGITVWDGNTGKSLHQVNADQTGSIACFAATPDGKLLASGGPDRWIRVWDAATGRLESAFRAHWEGVRCLKFSPDGRELLSGSELGTVRIHDAATGEERLAFYGLTKPVADVDISADGKLIAAISSDAVTMVWDRQRSSAAALLPKVVSTVEPVAATSPTAKKAPQTTPKPALPKDAEGWENLLAALTPDEVEKTSHGWSLKDGELFSPDTKFAMLRLPAEVSTTSYTVSVKLRRLAGKKQECFHIVLPIADRMCGFELEGRPQGGIYTGLVLVNGKHARDLPEVVEGRQIKDTEPHALEVTVRLDGANAAIISTLDGKPLYEWTGPTAALRQDKRWATTDAGSLALGTAFGGWAVSEVKVKRLEGE
jgi:eukaryotic-like serine/threonine-protein kinase